MSAAFTQPGAQTLAVLCTFSVLVVCKIRHFLDPLSLHTSYVNPPYSTILIFGNKVLWYRLREMRTKERGSRIPKICGRHLCAASMLIRPEALGTGQIIITGSLKKRIIARSGSQKMSNFVYFLARHSSTEISFIMRSRFGEVCSCCS